MLTMTRPVGASLVAPRTPGARLRRGGQIARGEARSGARTRAGRCGDRAFWLRSKRITAPGAIATAPLRFGRGFCSRSWAADEPVPEAIEHDRLATRGLRRPKMAVVGEMCKQPSDENHDVFAFRIDLKALSNILEQRRRSNSHSLERTFEARRHPREVAFTWGCWYCNVSDKLNSRSSIFPDSAVLSRCGTRGCRRHARPYGRHFAAVTRPQCAAGAIDRAVALNERRRFHAASRDEEERARTAPGLRLRSSVNRGTLTRGWCVVYAERKSLPTRAILTGRSP